MIRYVDDTLLEQLQQFLTEHRSIYACRIGCCLQSYGLHSPFDSFYLQINEQDNVIGAAADYYHDLTLLLTAESDLDEWRCWAEMTGFHSLLCDTPLLPDYSIETGAVMTLTHPLPAPSLPTGFTVTEQPDLKALWHLLKSCENTDFAVPAYEDFLPDISHKLRHGTAVCRVLQKNGYMMAAAMTVALTEHTALIGGVATAPDYRRQGFGAYCVRTLCTDLNGRTIYLMRDIHRHADFYQQCGFETTASFYMINEKERTP